MSATWPFRGKWRVQDDVLFKFWTFQSSLGDGEPLILYRMGGSGSVDYVYCAVQPDGVEAKNPAQLAKSYLTQRAASAYVVKTNGFGSTTGGSSDEKAVRFLFKDDDDEKTNSFSAIDGPANGVFGLWVPTSGGEFFGWSTSNVPPKSYVYSLRVDAPSAAHARQWLGNVVPPGADYSFVDISGEDYSGITMTDAKFAGADLTGTNFHGSDLSGADFRRVYSLAGTKLAGVKLNGAQFAGVDLSGVDFTGCDLTAADFRTVKSLQGTVFTGANLSNARFDNVDLTGQKFVGVTMTGAYLAQANLTNTLFADSGDSGGPKANLAGVDFSVAKTIQGARFSCALLSTKFAGLAMKDVNFTGAQMKGTNFQGCDLRLATFSNPPVWSDDATHLTNLSHGIIGFSQIGLNWSFMNLVGITIDGLPQDLSNLNAQSSLMQGWTLANHNLGGAILSNANLCGASMTNCNLKLARMDNVQLQEYEAVGHAAVLSESYLEEVDLSNANLTGTTMTGVYLFGDAAKLSGAIIQDTDFASAYLLGLEFKSIANNQCYGVNFDYACLVNTDFQGTHLSSTGTGEGAHLSKTCLQGADFTGAYLAGADLSESAVDENPGTILVTIPLAWPYDGKNWTFEAAYDGTKGIEAATDASTTCPSGETGSCTGSKLVSDQAPKKWPVKHYAGKGHRH
ncbi:hypothetical protein GCM10009839_37250 [Catenulispora yoronensis]|uniref:Pentapeptide repeat-containing protein n=1 Tax=Catenulispora yoronensis TaxID=450799 RepID=A0ABP5FT10_9ACTN